MNAVIHRDYSTGTPIQIRVYDNKIELRNTCCLPEGWTARSIAVKNQSRLHNPNIAKMFFLANMVEIWGHGIKKMRGECRASGVPGPKIRGSKTDICLEFKNHEADMRKKLGRKSKEKGTPDVTMKMTIKMTMKILEILSVNPKSTIPELERQIAKSESTVWRQAMGEGLKPPKTEEIP